MESEVIEVQMAPGTAAFIHQTDHDFLTDECSQVNDNLSQRFAVRARHLVEDFAGVFADQFDSCLFAVTAVGQERRKGL